MDAVSTYSINHHQNGVEEVIILSYVDDVVADVDRVVFGKESRQVEVFDRAG